MEILKVYQRKLRFKRLATSTINSYSFYLEEFLKKEKIKDPYQVTTTQIINYLEYFEQQKELKKSFKIVTKILDK